MNDFFSMDGYAGYVWSCFGISLVVVVALIIEAKSGLRKTRNKLAQRLAQETQQ